MAKTGWISIKNLNAKDLRASSVLAPDTAIEKQLTRMRRARDSLNTGIANKERELGLRSAKEALLIEQGTLHIYEDKTHGG